MGRVGTCFYNAWRGDFRALWLAINKIVWLSQVNCAGQLGNTWTIPKRNMLFDKIYYLYIQKKETWGNSVVCRMDRFLIKQNMSKKRVATQGLHSNRISLDLLCFVWILKISASGHVSLPLFITTIFTSALFGVCEFMLRERFKQITSWRFQPIWKILVNFDPYPHFGDEKKQYLKPPPRIMAKSTHSQVIC